MKTNNHLIAANYARKLIESNWNQKDAIQAGQRLVRLNSDSAYKKIKQILESA